MKGIDFTLALRKAIGFGVRISTICNSILERNTRQHNARSTFSMFFVLGRFWVRILGSIHEIRSILNFSGPAGGSALERASPPTKRNQIACRDDKAILYSTSSGANCSEHARRIFRKLFHKNEDISRSCLRISLRSFQIQEKGIWLRMV